MRTEGHRDVVIVCAHGERDVRGEFVQRFRWIDSQAAWVPTSAPGLQSTHMKGDSEDVWLLDPSPGDEPAGPRRVHREITCPGCPNSVSADDESLIQVFTMLGIWASQTGEPAAQSRGFREAFAVLVVGGDERSVTMTLDNLRRGLTLRRKIMNP